MKKLVILIDMDGIAADLVGKVLRLYNAEHNTAFTHANVTDWNFDKCIPNGKAIFRYFDAPGFFRDLQPLPGVVRTLQELKKAGHELHIASTPHVKGTCAEDKMAWVQEHLPFIGMRNTILIRDKSMLKGDVLIDDKPDTIEKYRTAWPSSYLASIAYPYNDCVKHHLNTHAPGIEDFEQAWDTIGESISRYALES